MMKRREWATTALVIGLLVLAILFAQSRRNCEGKGAEAAGRGAVAERGGLRFD